MKEKETAKAARKQGENLAVQNAEPPAAAKEENALEQGAQSAVEALREQYENSIEYRLGCEILDGLTQSYGLNSDDALAILEGGYAKKPAELIGGNAARALQRLNEENKLARPIEDYLKDGEFIAMLTQMPAELAVRLKQAQWQAENAESSAAAQRTKGEQQALEQLKARQALPAPMRCAIPVSAQPDFVAMTSREFEDFKRNRFR